MGNSNLEGKGYHPAEHGVSLTSRGEVERLGAEGWVVCPKWYCSTCRKRVRSDEVAPEILTREGYDSHY